MARRRREPRAVLTWCATVLVLLAPVACDRGDRHPGASGTPRPGVESPSASVLGATPTPPPAGATVIGVLGDWGYDGGPVRDVVRLMETFDGGRPLDAVVTTGDNAYARGTPEQAAFAAGVIAPLLRDGTPLYAAVGNHDLGTDAGRPVMRALRIPRPWYTVTIGPVQLVVLHATHPYDPRQLAFLRRVLSRPRRVPFRVVAFHQPGWSCSAHPPEPGVIAKWIPLFQGRVDLVLAGHNHTYERFAAPDGTPYVTTGGGGAPLYPSIRATCRGYGRVAFLKTAYHAVRLTATRTRMVLEAIGLDGRPFDTLTITPRPGG